MLSQLKKYSILYVEDDLSIQKLIKNYLENYFGDVYIATTGEEALIRYKEYYPDVLLLDIDIPLISGLEVARLVREQNKYIKIVMLTAYADQEKLLNATELKLSKYLIKPIPPKEFKEVMELLSKELTEDPNHYIPICSHCIWDIKLEQLFLNDDKVLFSEKEQQLFKLLVQTKGLTVSYEDIMIHVWDDAWQREISIDSVKILMSRMRKKLPEGCITSVYGKGYILL
jgi:DNA-binding response OmpR family regulator